MEWVGNYPILFNLLDEFLENCYFFFFKYLIKFPRKALCAWRYLCGKFLIQIQRLNGYRAMCITFFIGSTFTPFLFFLIILAGGWSILLIFSKHQLWFHWFSLFFCFLYIGFCYPPYFPLSVSSGFTLFSAHPPVCLPSSVGIEGHACGRESFPALHSTWM